MPLTIGIRTIPHTSQRYDTCGDWYTDGQHFTHILVSEMHNWKYELLVALHELVEQSLCRDRHITEEAVTAFDQDFEAQRLEGDDSEPGDAPLAPYRREHNFATNIERQLAHELGIDWVAYEKAIGELG